MSLVPSKWVLVPSEWVLVPSKWVLVPSKWVLVPFKRGKELSQNVSWWRRRKRNTFHTWENKCLLDTCACVREREFVSKSVRKRERKKERNRSCVCACEREWPGVGERNRQKRLRAFAIKRYFALIWLLVQCSFSTFWELLRLARTLMRTFENFKKTENPNYFLGMHCKTFLM